MEEEKKDPWLTYLALTTVFLAVCATLATFKGNSYSTRSIMYQTQAANQWAYFQAKGVKGYLYEIQKEELELDLQRAKAAIQSFPEARQEKVSYLELEKQKIGEYEKKIAKYDSEKAGIQQEARRLEALRDEAREHNQAFGVAIIFLQIAILLSSIAALLKKKPLWFLGMALGVAGVVYFANGFLLFF